MGEGTGLPKSSQGLAYAGSNKDRVSIWTVGEAQHPGLPSDIDTHAVPRHRQSVCWPLSSAFQNTLWFRTSNNLVKRESKLNLCESRKVCRRLPVVNPEMVSPGEEEEGETVVLHSYKV